MSLTGKFPADFYLWLTYMAQFDATLRPLTIGEDVALPLQASTAGINFTGTVTKAGEDLLTAADVGELIAAAIATAIGPLLGPNLFDAQAIDSAGTTAKSPLRSMQNIIPVSLAAGAGAYTAILKLDTATAVKGNRVEIAIALPAGAGRTLTIQDGSGAELDTFTSLDAATTAGFAAYFDGAAWQNLNQSMIRNP